nr:hypothetical protein [Polymorphobacter sp.]
MTVTIDPNLIPVTADELAQGHADAVNAPVLTEAEVGAPPEKLPETPLTQLPPG